MELSEFGLSSVTSFISDKLSGFGEFCLWIVLVLKIMIVLIIVILMVRCFLLMCRCQKRVLLDLGGMSMNRDWLTETSSRLRRNSLMEN